MNDQMKNIHLALLRVGSRRFWRTFLLMTAVLAVHSFAQSQETNLSATPTQEATAVVPAPQGDPDPPVPTPEPKPVPPPPKRQSRLEPVKEIKSGATDEFGRHLRVQAAGALRGGPRPPSTSSPMMKFAGRAPQAIPEALRDWRTTWKWRKILPPAGTSARADSTRTWPTNC